MQNKIKNNREEFPKQKAQQEYSTFRRTTIGKSRKFMKVSSILEPTPQHKSNKKDEQISIADNPIRSNKILTSRN